MHENTHYHFENLADIFIFAIFVSETIKKIKRESNNL